MTQFMNALHNYLICSVLHASWNEFEKDLQNSRTIDQIYLSHMNYIKRILSRSLGLDWFFSIRNRTLITTHNIPILGACSTHEEKKCAFA